ncbi:hypothetical protein RchiOBHm_Chr3g0451771 [Rosa chinensis]|uniref:Uncharacterized protein n=1 Tax=Rosa chinensis TaxID=74649 RepID=A0A2P6R647_ROSCH|nr:hypothetical protein RchiOBHm_Chr3g0451771 [Rosa chinensis]
MRHEAEASNYLTNNPRGYNNVSSPQILEGFMQMQLPKEQKEVAVGSPVTKSPRVLHHSVHDFLLSRVVHYCFILLFWLIYICLHTHRATRISHFR